MKFCDFDTITFKDLVTILFVEFVTNKSEFVMNTPRSPTIGQCP